jgi:hypothetical protein
MVAGHSKKTLNNKTEKSGTPRANATPAAQEARYAQKFPLSTHIISLSPSDRIS